MYRHFLDTRAVLTNALTARCPSLVAWLCGTLLVWPIAGFSADVSLDEIRATLAEELQSIHSLRVKYTITSKSNPPYSVGAGTSECEWIRQGDQLFNFTKPRQFPGGKWAGVLRTYDGKTTHSVVFDRQDPQRYAKLFRIQSYMRDDWTSVNPGSFIGLQILDSDETLVSLILREQAQVIGVEVVDGTDTVHIDLGTVTESNGVEWNAQTWLLPGRNFLPAKLYLSADPDKPKHKEVGLVANAHYSYRSIRWGQFEDKQLERLRDYPTVAIMDSPLSSSVFDIREVVFNEAIPIAQFQLKPQTGTEVTERVSARDTNQVVWIEGGSTAIAAQQNQLVEEARKRSSEKSARQNTSNVSVDARPKEGVWVYRLWVFTLLACGLISFQYFYRLRRGSM